MEEQDFPAEPIGMHHWLLRSSSLLAAVLSIWAALSFATPMLRDRIHPVVHIVSQQPQSGPQTLSLPPAYRYSSPSVTAKAIGKRDGIYVQELNSNYLVHYHVFTVSVTGDSLPSSQATSFKKTEATRPFFLPSHMTDPVCIRRPA